MSSGSAEKKQYSFQIADPEIQEFLDSAENKSELLREGAKRIAWERDGVGIDDPELSESQANAYQWLIERKGSNRVSIDVFSAKVAQNAQISKELVKDEIVKPLVSSGYLRVDQHMTGVELEAIPPGEVEQ